MKFLCEHSRISSAISLLHSYRGRRWWSQEGEDLLLSRIFDEKKSAGFYVDIGSHHPFRFSNTYWAYRKGWSGINVEPNPAAISLFKRFRPRDINISCAVGHSRDQAFYYPFAEGALNTLSRNRKDSLRQIGLDSKSVVVQLFPLGQILKENLPSVKTHIDFMSVDVEGYEMDVLAGNLWDVFRPKYIVIEISGVTPKNLDSQPVSQFLTNQHYLPISILYHSVFFLDQKNERHNDSAFLDYNS